MRIIYTFLFSILCIYLNSQENDTLYSYKWFSEDIDTRGFINTSLTFTREARNNYNSTATKNTHFIFEENGKFGLEDIYKNKLTSELYESIYSKNESEIYHEFFLASKIRKNADLNKSKYSLYSTNFEEPISKEIFSELGIVNNILYLFDTLYNEYFLISKKIDHNKIIDSLIAEKKYDTSKSFNLIINEKDFLIFNFKENLNQEKLFDSIEIIFLKQNLENNISTTRRKSEKDSAENFKDTLSNDTTLKLFTNHLIRERFKKTVEYYREYLRIENNSIQIHNSDTHNPNTDYLIKEKFEYSKNKEMFVCSNASKEYCLINSKGEIIIPYQPRNIDLVTKTGNGLIMQLSNNGNNVKIINEKGIYITNEEYIGIYAVELNEKKLLVAITKNNRKKLLSTDGQNILNDDFFKISVINGKFLLLKKEKKNGKIFLGKKKFIDVKDGYVTMYSENNNIARIGINTGKIKTYFHVTNKGEIYLPLDMQNILKERKIYNQ